MPEAISKIQTKEYNPLTLYITTSKPQLMVEVNSNAYLYDGATGYIEWRDEADNVLYTETISSFDGGLY
jgi:hypothetical protein